MTAATSHACKPARGGTWYRDDACGLQRACRTCNHLDRCLRDGHDWVQSPIAIGVLWCSRCQVVDGFGITSGLARMG